MALRKRLWRALLRRIGCDAESFSTVPETTAQGVADG
jgi:hypothetical protein